jgi:predicted DCC family thiol-disulfide oxidoreductase YuxK
VSPDTPITVYFDGACPLCRREIAFYRRRIEPTSADFVDVSGEEGHAPAADLDRCAALRRLHVRLSDGRLVSGASAFTAMWRVTPGLRFAGRILGRRPWVNLLELAYRGFLGLRPRLQRLAGAPP